MNRDETVAATREQVRAVEERLSSALGDGDARTAAGQYTQSAVLLLPGLPELVGRDAIEAHYRQVLDRQALDVESRAEDVLVAGDLAVVRGSVVQWLGPEGGGDRPSLPLRHLIVFLREDDGEWRLAWDMVQQGVLRGAGDGRRKRGVGWLRRLASQLGRRR